MNKGPNATIRLVRRQNHAVTTVSWTTVQREKNSHAYKLSSNVQTACSTDSLNNCPKHSILRFSSFALKIYLWLKMCQHNLPCSIVLPTACFPEGPSPHFTFCSFWRRRPRLEAVLQKNNLEWLLQKKQSKVALTEKQSREVGKVMSSLNMIVMINKGRARLSNNTDPYEMPHSVQKRTNYRELCYWDTKYYLYQTICAYSKTCVKQPLSKRQKIGFQDRLLLNAGQKVLQNAPSWTFCNTFNLH